MKRIICYILAMLALIGLLVRAIGCDDENRFRVATTTSLYDTGLWDYLEPIFEDKYDVEMDVLSAGTGIALRYGENGDVDVIAVHSKSRELEFITNKKRWSGHLQGKAMRTIPEHDYILLVNKI